MTQPEPTASTFSVTTTYKFDVMSVTTFDVTTAHGEGAARQAAESLESYEPGFGIDAAPTAPDVTFEMTCTAPRGRAYLVETEGDSGEELPEPIDGEHRAALKDELENAIQALEGDSNDAEHDALRDLAETVAAVLGEDFNPRSPYDDWAEDDKEVDAIADGTSD